MTVSNLSQAIRFLVDNDFLENVELKPGQAAERMIEVIDQQQHPSPRPQNSGSIPLETTPIGPQASAESVHAETSDEMETGEPMRPL